MSIIVLSALFILFNVVPILLTDGSSNIVYNCEYSIYGSSLLFIVVTVPTISFQGGKNTVRIFEWVAGIYVLIDVFLVIVLESGFGVNDEGQFTYFTGSKFAANYMYLLWMLLFLHSRIDNCG